MKLHVHINAYNVHINAYNVHINAYNGNMLVNVGTSSSTVQLKSHAIISFAITVSFLVDNCCRVCTMFNITELTMFNITELTMRRMLNFLTTAQWETFI